LERGKSLFQTSYNILADGKRPNNAQKSIKKVLNNAENQLKNELSKKTIAEILIEMNG
jgi:DNA-binding IscR family transcriptional regulator